MNPKYHIGIIAGAFDIIHPGYVRLFKDATNVCDFLIVALHEDPSLENGKSKPVLTRSERLEILQSIRYINYILFYTTEEQLLRLMKEIRPNVIIVGSDHRGKPITGEDLKIPIYYHERDHDWSETKLKLLVAETIRRSR